MIFLLVNIADLVLLIYLSRYLDLETRRQWRELFGLLVKLPPVINQLIAQINCYRQGSYICWWCWACWWWSIDHNLISSSRLLKGVL